MEDPEIVSLSLNACMFIVHAFLQPLTLQVLIGILSMIFLLYLSAMISGSEIAFFSLNPTDMHKVRNSQGKRNKMIIELLEKPKSLLATILIANNFVNVAIVILSTYISAELFDLSINAILAFLIQVVIVTALILLFGETIPKMYATRKPLSFALMMAGVLKSLTWLLRPLTLLLVRSTNIFDKKLARKNLNITMSDLNDAIEITSDETTPEDERKILKGIVKFGDIEVKEIMKSRVDVVAVEHHTKFSDLLKIIIDSGYSRIPVYKDSFDAIEGILYVKDLLPHLSKGNNFEWYKLIRDAFFVPENKKINDLLQEFQETKVHLAIIVDEYGGTSGIVTLEDIIEEIVGEISDEFDNIEDDIEFERLGDNTYIFEGKTSINDFCKIINIEDDVFNEVKGESDTLAGLILEMEGKIPEKDHKIVFKQFTFEIAAADERRIQKVKITINENPY